MKVLNSICQQIWKTQQWPKNWKMSVFIPIPKKSNIEECSNYCTIALISHSSKVMLKFLQARFQHYVNQKLPDVQVGFRKGRDQIANICWIIEKAREFKKAPTSDSLTTPRPLTVWITTNYGQFLKRRKYKTVLPVSWETCAGQETTVRTRHRKMDWFKIGKVVCQGCILSPCFSTSC